MTFLAKVFLSKSSASCTNLFWTSLKLYNTLSNFASSFFYSSAIHLASSSSGSMLPLSSLLLLAVPPLPSFPSSFKLSLLEDDFFDLLDLDDFASGAISF